MKTREDFFGETEGKVSDMKRKHRACSKMRRWSRPVLFRTEPGQGQGRTGRGPGRSWLPGSPERMEWRVESKEAVSSQGLGHKKASCTSMRGSDLILRMGIHF